MIHLYGAFNFIALEMLLVARNQWFAGQVIMINSLPLHFSMRLNPNKK